MKVNIAHNTLPVTIIGIAVLARYYDSKLRASFIDGSVNKPQFSVNVTS